MNPPRALSASPQEIQAAALVDFLAMLGKQDLLIGGKHARKKIVKHLHPAAGQRIALSMALESERFEGVELIQPTSDEASNLNAIALHHLTLSEDSEGQLAKAGAALKPGGILVLHDLVWRQEPPKELLEGISTVWGHPLSVPTVPELWATLEGLSLEGVSLDLGAFAWFRPKQFARDESKYASDIMFNALNNEAGRKRYLAALDHFNEFERFYGYVVISGRKAGGE